MIQPTIQSVLDRWKTAIMPDPARLHRDWSFVPSTPSIRTRLKRLAAGSRAVAFPDYRVVRAVTPSERWNCLFLFLPAGKLDDTQKTLLQTMASLRGKLFVVAALSPDTAAPRDLDIADALATKDLAGFDFSAYRIALATIATQSPNALIYVQNDSVFGPLVDLDPLIENAPWDLTGFIANPVGENHISSFAFVVRALTPDRLAHLAQVLPADRCYDRFTDVVAMQEMQFARIAARHMSVGSYWYASEAPPSPRLAGSVWRRLTRWSGSVPLDLRGDPLLGMPLWLTEQGFPFVKRSIFGKFAGGPDAAAISTILAARGWPVDALPAPNHSPSTASSLALDPQKASGS